MPDSTDAESAPTIAPAPLLLSGAHLPDGRRVDVRLSGGRIDAVGCVGSLSAPERIDLAGYLLLPAPAEPHSHLDEALTSECGRPPRSGRPAPAERARRPPRTAPGADRLGIGGSPRGSRLGDGGRGEDLGDGGARGGADRCGAGSNLGGDTAAGAGSATAARVQRAVVEGALTALGYGATAQRTHVRVGDVHGLTRLEAVLGAGQALRGLLELQTVAGARLLTGLAGADGRALLRDAMKAGADAVGGCPDLDPDPAGYVEELLAVATEFGCPVDLHIDGADPARLARLTAALAPLRPRVALGPLTRLGGAQAARAAAAAGVFAVCLPQSGACTGCGDAAAEAGTGADAARGAGGCAPVRLLRAAGARVAAGSGGLRDAANPVGRADPLEAAFLLAATGAADPAAAYGAVSAEARALMGLPPVRIDAGFPAELLAVRGESLPAVLSGGHSRVVVHAGRVVSRTSAVREFGDPGPEPPPLPRQLRPSGQ